MEYSFFHTIHHVYSLDDDREITTGLHEIVAGEPYMDPESYTIQQENRAEIFKKLAGLSKDEREAVVVVCELETLFGIESPDKSRLMKVFGTTDLSQYVET